MRKFLAIITLLVMIFLLFTPIVNAQSGCCSWHSGVCGCSSSGRKICCDGQLSPTCTCTPIKSTPSPTTTPSNTIIFYTLRQCTDKYNEIVKQYNVLTDQANQLQSSYNQTKSDYDKCSLDLNTNQQTISDITEIKNWLIFFLIVAGIWLITLYAKRS